MGFLWPFMYTIAFGLTGAYYAKRMKKNPYLWFFLGSLFKLYTPIIILFLISVKRIIKYLVLKKIRTSFGTRPNQAYQEEKASPSPVFPKEETPLFWYYLTENKETKGPVSSLGLQQLQKEGSIAENTLVWNETFENWTPFKQAFPTQT